MMSNKRPVVTPDDMKGQTIRVQESPTYVAMMKAMGANPVPIAYVEVYLAMKQGTIDGMELPSFTFTSDKFQEVTKYYSLTRHSYPPIAWFMNLKKYQALPADVQKVVDDSMKDACQLHRRLEVGKEKSDFEVMKKAGVQINDVKDMGVPGPHEAGLRLRRRPGGQGVHDPAPVGGPGGVEVVRGGPGALAGRRGPAAGDDGGAVRGRISRGLLPLRDGPHVHLVRRDRPPPLRVDRVPGRGGGGTAQRPLPPAPPGRPLPARPSAGRPRGRGAGGDGVRPAPDPAGLEAGGAGPVPAHAGDGPLQAVRLPVGAGGGRPDHPLQPAAPLARPPRGAGPGRGMIPIIAVSFVVLLLLGIPVAFVIGVAGFIGLWWSGEYPLTVIVKQIFEGVDSFVLLAIPLFILAGAFMETGGIAVRLVRLAQVLVGWIRGGLSMAVVVAEYIFSGISGSTVADVSAIGSTMIPPM